MTGFQYIVEKLLEIDFEQQHVSKKYANKKFLKASNFALDWARRNFGNPEDYVKNEDQAEEKMLPVA